MDYIYKNNKDYNPNKKQKILIVFDDRIADMLSNKKLNTIVTEVYSRKKTKYFSCFLLHNPILQSQKILD